MANRLLHIEVEISFDSWKSWAINKGLNPLVIGYLDFDRKALMAFDASTEDLAFATPRSWEMVSNLLNAANSDIDKVYDLISGLISIPAAMEFRHWCKLCSNLPSIADIFDGKSIKPPKKSDELYSLVGAMTSYASAHRDDMERIENSLRFAQQLPPDFSVVLMRNYMSFEKDYRQKLLQCPTFSRWLNSKGSLLNGNI
ncbi:MAG: hypothetical protein J6Z35_04310 [Lachnospiraceae bacterium]|nr:hypothetical protein [Lachnospiraceae bacterium]